MNLDDKRKAILHHRDTLAFNMEDFYHISSSYEGGKKFRIYGGRYTNADEINAVEVYEIRYDD